MFQAPTTPFWASFSKLSMVLKDIKVIHCLYSITEIHGRFRTKLSYYKWPPEGQNLLTLPSDHANKVQGCSKQGESLYLFRVYKPDEKVFELVGLSYSPILECAGHIFLDRFLLLQHQLLMIKYEKITLSRTDLKHKNKARCS